MGEYVIAKYIRLSLDDAKTDSMSIGNQRLTLDKYIAELDIPDATVIEFVDNGYSGTDFERPAVQELLELVRQSGVNCIVVKDFSRFGRNMVETGYFIEMVFPLFRTRFVSVADHYDSAEHAGDTGGMEIAFKFLVHEYYSRDLSRKIKSAKHEKMWRGELTTKNCAFGYRKGANGGLEIDENAAATVRLIFTLALEGNSVAEIARRLYEEKCPSPSEYKGHVWKKPISCLWEKSVILKLLSDEQYTGMYVAGKTRVAGVGSHAKVKVDKSEWIRIPDHHPAIIEKPRFDAVRAIIDIKGKPLRKRKLDTWQRYSDERNSPLKGKVVCGCCGHKMSLSSTKNAAFHCGYSRVAPDAECYRLRILASELAATVYDTISKQAQTMRNVNSVDDSSVSDNRHRRLLEQDGMIERLQERKQRLYERFILREITADEYRALKEEYDAELHQLVRVRSSLAAQAENQRANCDATTKIRIIAEDAQNESGLSQGLVDRLIGKILVYPNSHFEVQWKVKEFGNSVADVG